VLSFSSSRQNWDSPNPSPTGECAPPHIIGSGGGRGTLAGERGVGRVPIPTRGVPILTRGLKLWYSLCIRTLWKKRAKLRLLDGVGHDRPPPVSHKGTAVVDEERGLQPQALQVGLAPGDDLFYHSRHPEPESSNYRQSIRP
jgi:hypothetical protein